MSFLYTLNVPNPPNNPSSDVGNMQTNTNSIAGLIAVDHIGFGILHGGAHDQVQLKEVGGSSPPAGLIGTGFETLYSQVVANPIDSGELFFVRGASATGIQLTATGNLASGLPVSAMPGASYLPGGLFVYWGTGVTTGHSTAVTFPFSGFPNNCFVVIPIAISDNGNFITSATFLTKTAFSLNTNSSTPFVNFNYIAIGN